MKKIFPILVITAILGFFSLALIIEKSGVVTAGGIATDKKHQAHIKTVFSEMKIKPIGKPERALKDTKAKVSILNFWASWCTPCLEEFPSLVALRKKYSKDQVQIIGFNADEEKKKKAIKKTTKKYKLNFDIVEDPEGKGLINFKVSALPVTIILHNGKVMEISNGAKDFMSGEFIEKVDKWIK